MVRRLVTSLQVTMTSYSSHHNIQNRRIRKLGSGSSIRVDPLA